MSDMSCDNCAYCSLCKRLVNGEWEMFHICKFKDNGANPYCVVVGGNDYCEFFYSKELEHKQRARRKKYEWHDLRKNPEDLPPDGKWVLWLDGEGNHSVERYKADAIDHFCPNGRWFGLKDAIAWKYNEPLDEQREDG